MRAFVVLVVLPVLIGIASERLFRDTARSTLAATYNRSRYRPQVAVVLQKLSLIHI